jgi:hypothetical protein
MCSDFEMVTYSKAEAERRGGMPFRIFLGNRISYLSVLKGEAISADGDKYPLDEVIGIRVTLDV